MADHQQQTSSTNDNAGTGVGNSVVSDLMRVYENLTQSSTPQAGVPDVSTSLSIAYNKNSNSNVPPQTSSTQIYQPPAGYPVPPAIYQQQQTGTSGTSNNPLHVAPHPALHAPGSNAGQQGYASVSMGAPPSVGPSPDDNKDIQRSGEESHHSSTGDVSSSSYSKSDLVRSSSVSSKTSMVLSSSIVHHHHQQQAPADASSESEKSSGGGRSRKKRKQQEGGAGGKKHGRGKKCKKEDGRWSKRFTWPEDLHRDFVSAIFDVGLKHSSPSSIMEHMPKHEQITTERIKSHLQKYRLHRVKSKKEFISSYEASLRSFQQNQGSAMVSGGGEVAAHMTANSLASAKAGSPVGTQENNALTTVSSANVRERQQLVKQSQNSSDSNESLMLPQLTEAEKQSPIGSAMGYLMGLFFSLKQQLIIQRSLEAAGEKAKGNALFSTSSAAIAPESTNMAPGTAVATAAAVAAGVEFAADGTMQQSQHASAQQAGVVVGAASALEENSMMKREMRNQMALQNKMRALKQQELAKYNSTEAAGGDHHFSIPSGSIESTALDGAHAIGAEQQHQQQHPQQPISADAPSQGAGEMAGNDFSTPAPPGDGSNNNLLQIDNSDDFWHTDVVDDQLFEFLMNH